jgi:Calcineurin-like phosphoesterase
MREQMKTDRIARAAFLLLALLVVCFQVFGQDTFDGVERIVAVGDLHGDFDACTRILRSANLIDKNNAWIGGRTHLVQTGDILDRGVEARKIIDLLMSLEEQAKKAGGRVHVLLGNHEEMNIRGDLRYVSADEYNLFKSPNAEDLRRRLFESEATPEQRKDSDYRKAWEKQHPLGWVERWIAFSQAGTYGKWLRRRNTVIRINGVLFLHGGISPKYASLEIHDINERVRAELLRPPMEVGTGIVADPEGPLWYRGMAQSPESELAAHVDNVLASFHVQHVVIAHTSAPGIVMPRFGGKVIMIDVGLSEAFGAGQACLEFEGGKPFAIHRGKALEIPIDTDVTAYIRAAGDLEPPNSLLRRYMDRLTKSTGQ